MTPNKFSEKDSFSFDDFRALVKFLRSPEGCSWDREQTHRSLRNNFVEEAYEVCEGIDLENNELLCEELGDVLLQVLFHAGIAEDEGAFSTEDVINGVAKKMVRRHPHLFADKVHAQARDTWEELKRKEKNEKGLKDSLLRVSTALPALKRAEKIAKKVGDAAPKREKSPSDEEKIRLGEMLYKLCLSSVEQKIDPEEALNRYLAKIIEKCTNYEQTF